MQTVVICVNRLTRYSLNETIRVTPDSSIWSVSATPTVRGGHCTKVTLCLMFLPTHYITRRGKGKNCTLFLCLTFSVILFCDTLSIDQGYPSRGPPASIMRLAATFVNYRSHKNYTVTEAARHVTSWNFLHARPREPADSSGYGPLQKKFGHP
jgi:hypothetical protein